MRQKLFFLPPLLVASTALSQQAIACECIDPRPTTEKLLEEADVVFAGEVIDLFWADGDIQMDRFGERRIIVRFEVTHVWKGNLSTIATLHTTTNVSSCSGYHFRVGERYLIFAAKTKASNWLNEDKDRGRVTLRGARYPRPDDIILDTGMCTGTNILWHAAKTHFDLDRLKPKGEKK